MPFQGEHRKSQSVAVALTELSLSFWLEQQRKVGETRHSVFPAKRLVEKHMKRCAWQPLLASNYMGDLHQVVVNNVGQMICRQLVGTLVQHLVVKNVAHDLYVASYEVVYMYSLSRLDFKPHHILLSLCDKPIHLFLWHRQRVAHQQSRRSVVLEILNLAALSLKLLWSVESYISLARLKKLTDILLIYFASLALPIWPMLAAK